MKKPLLKAALICLEITLLCGLYSFKIPEGVKSQQSYRTIVYDTIITPDGEGSECIKKEVVIEGGKDGCTCTLKVDIHNKKRWSLLLEKSCYGETVPNVQVTYEYKLYSVNFENGSSEDFVNSDSKIIRCTEIFLGRDKNKYILFDKEYYKSVCVPVSLEACFVQ